MNIFRDRSCIRICFYIIFTFVCIYVSARLIDALLYSLANIDDIFSAVKYFLARLCSVFSILVLGFVFAYILKPAVCAVERKTGLKRGASSAVVFLAFIVFIISVTAVTAYSIDYESLGTEIVDYGRNVNAIYSDIKRFFDTHRLFYAENILNSINTSLSGFMARLCADIINISGKLLSRIITVFVSLAAGYYMLRDEERITSALSRYTQRLAGEGLKERACFLLADLNSIFSRYLRGQLTDGAIMAGLISLSLAVIRVPFAVIIGLVSGFSNIIPYFGSILGFVLSVGMALVSGEPIRAIYAAIVILILQQIDSVFIVPKVVGESVSLSPAVIIISLAVFGKLFGIWGMVLAVPLTAFVKLRLDRFCERRDENEQGCG